jgi:hypothetical protein
MLPFDDALVFTPVLFSTLPAAKALYSGAESAVAVLTDNRIVYWGDFGGSFGHFQSEQLPGTTAAVITSPMLDPATIGFGGGWVGGLTASGTYVHLLSEPLNTYDGYPFRTASHPRGSISLDYLEIYEALKKSCSNAYGYGISADVPIVLSTDTDYGSSPVTPYHYESLELGGTRSSPWGGAGGDCSGAFTVKLTVRTTSVWTWAPDGQSWVKTASKTWN